MNLWLHKKEQSRYWCDANQGENDRKIGRVVWMYAMKTIGGTGEENGLHNF